MGIYMLELLLAVVTAEELWRRLDLRNSSALHLVYDYNNDTG